LTSQPSGFGNKSLESPFSKLNLDLTATAQIVAKKDPAKKFYRRQIGLPKFASSTPFLKATFSSSELKVKSTKE
jgi:hypothetical protein